LINVFQPSTGHEEAQAVKRVLDSHWPGKGAKTSEFEFRWAEHIGAEPNRIVSTNSATEGLFQIMRLLADRGVRDVVMPSLNFIGAGNAALAADIRIHFCDVDRHTLNATAESIAAVMPEDRPVAVVILHYGGLPCDMTEILGVCDRRGVYLIEDAACAPASTSKGFACGTFGHFGVWSFDAMKIITTGDGGMIYCSKPDVADMLHARFYLGMDSANGLSKEVEDRWWEFNVAPDETSRRSITNDIATAIGLEQLKKLPAFVARRKAIAQIYDDRLDSLNWLYIPPATPEGDHHSHYLYWIQTEERDALAHHLRDNGIYTTFRYWPIHRAYSKGHFVPFANVPNTEWAADHTLCLPIHQGLSDEDVNYICDQVTEFGHTRTETSLSISAAA